MRFPAPLLPATCHLSHDEKGGPCVRRRLTWPSFSAFFHKEDTSERRPHLCTCGLCRNVYVFEEDRIPKRVFCVAHYQGQDVQQVSASPSFFSLSKTFLVAKRLFGCTDCASWDCPRLWRTCGSIAMLLQFMNLRSCPAVAERARVPHCGEVWEVDRVTAKSQAEILKTRTLPAIGAACAHRGRVVVNVLPLARAVAIYCSLALRVAGYRGR